MERNFYVLILILVTVTVIAFVYKAYHLSKLAVANEPWYYLFFPKKPVVKACNAKDTTALKKHIQNAVNAIRANITILKGEDVLTLRPHILLTKYPFYIDVLKLPAYLDEHPCYDPTDVNKAIKDLYGPINKAEALHVSIPGYPRYLVLLDVVDAVEYYRTYKESLRDIIV